MEVTLHIPDEIAKGFPPAEGMYPAALEAIALQGYRQQTLRLYQVSEMLALSRIEMEDFLGHHHIPLAVIDQSDSDREAASFEAATRRSPRRYARGMEAVSQDSASALRNWGVLPYRRDRNESCRY